MLVFKYKPAKDPAETWDRFHIGYASSFQNHFFLLVVDAKFKWIELNIYPTIYPSKMVSDNETIFTSEDFKIYCKKNDIFLKLIASVHPSTNVLAERNVQKFKRKLKTMWTERGSIHNEVNQILQRCRATPLACGKSSAEFYYTRKPIIKIESTKPIPDIRQLKWRKET